MSFTSSRIVWESYSDFSRTHIETFKCYKKYGEVVLQTDLETDLDGKNPEFIEIFTESKALDEFEKKLKNYWFEHHRFIVDKISDIIKIYNKFGAGVNVYKVKKYFPNDTTEPVIIFEELFEDIPKQRKVMSSKFYDTILLEHNKYIYLLEYHDSYFKIVGRYKENDVIIHIQG